MAIFAVSVRQARERGGVVLYKWSNVFKLDSPSALAAAAAGVGAWVGFLRNAVRQDVFCYEVYATDELPATQSFATQSVPEGQQRGTITEDIGQAYWPDICLNVELLVEAQRPDRKYWRPGLTENDFVDGIYINPTLTAAIEAAFNGMIGAASALGDGQGNEFLSASVSKAGVRRLGRLSRFDLPTPPAEG